MTWFVCTKHVALKTILDIERFILEILTLKYIYIYG